MVRPTRQGISTFIIGIIAVLTGRVFGIIELYIVAAALFLLPIGSWLVLALSSTRLTIDRRIHPRMVEAGSNGLVRLDVNNRASLPSPVIDLVEPIGTSNSATIEIARLSAHDSIAAMYHIPTHQRGLVSVGPLTMIRTDLFRLARRRRQMAGSDELVVTPTTVPLGPPSDTAGPLGNHLRSAAQRLGRGDFHSLRDYVPGDEMRSIHWKASARSDELKVKQHDRQVLDRCTIVLDLNAEAYPPGAGQAAAFERAVSAAASVVEACHHGDMNTRFTAGTAIDHRGPDVLTDTLVSLARVELTSDGHHSGGGAGSPPLVLEPGDGLGLLIIVSGTATAAAQLGPRRTDPGTTRLSVCSAESGGAWNQIDATSLATFQTEWDALVGHSFGSVSRSHYGSTDSGQHPPMEATTAAAAAGTPL